MLNKDKLKKLIYEINLQYNHRMYQLVSGDMLFKSIPQKLCELWHLVHCKLDALYIRVQAGEEEIESAYEKIIALKDAFAHEFELIDKANITKGE